MRTISELYNKGDIVFIKLDNELIEKNFLQDALNEGFQINGKNKIKKSFLKEDIYFLDDNFKIYSISGFIMHMFYGSYCKENDGKSVVRIDYARYKNNFKNYIITKKDTFE